MFVFGALSQVREALNAEPLPGTQDACAWTGPRSIGHVQWDCVIPIIPQSNCLLLLLSVVT